jgi:hypothetical protein
MIAVRENPLRAKTTPGALGAFPCPPDEHLGIRAAGQRHELRAQVLLQGAPGQTSASCKLLANVVRHVTDRDRGHASIVHVPQQTANGRGVCFVSVVPVQTVR